MRAAWQRDPQRSESVFDAIAAIVGSARQAIEYGWTEQLGPLMDANQAQLRLLGVSSPPLERLIEPAKAAGAAGAKLSGGGRGGCMLALVEQATERRVVEALRGAGGIGAYFRGAAKLRAFPKGHARHVRMLLSGIQPGS